MALTRILTDWVTLQGDGVHVGGATQPQDCYLDIAGGQDFVFYLILSNRTAPSGSFGVLALEAAPDKNDALFVALTSWTLGSGLHVATIGTNVAVVPYTLIPASRWLRWRISNYIVSWTVTMRIVVAINPGNYAPGLIVPHERGALREMTGSTTPRSARVDGGWSQQKVRQHA